MSVEGLNGGDPGVPRLFLGNRGRRTGGTGNGSWDRYCRDDYVQRFRVKHWYSSLETLATERLGTLGRDSWESQER